MVKDAEKAKARIFATPGKDANVNNYSLTPTAMVDEGYIVVGTHLDQQLIDKIVKGEYIDFGKLIPRDCVLSEEDSKLELVIRNGKTFWTPVSPTTNVSNFN